MKVQPDPTVKLSAEVRETLASPPMQPMGELSPGLRRHLDDYVRLKANNESLMAVVAVLVERLGGRATITKENLTHHMGSRLRMADDSFSDALILDVISE